MKILIPHTVGKSSLANPFVRTLRDGLLACGHEVVCSKDAFWALPKEYDIVFFQWPESILNETKTGPSLEKIKEQIGEIKKAGVPIAITCHNLHPHDENTFLLEVYDYLYSQADVFHHLGDYSFQLMKSKYPDAHHFVAPHQAFYHIEEKELSRKSYYRDKFGIPQNKITILSFGAFRNDDEREMFAGLAKHNSNKYCLWAPKIYRDTLRKKNFLTRTACAWRYLYFRAKGIRMQSRVPVDEDVMPMICAADILFIQRKEILNSGNLPLGFSAGKIVVGPDLGNVGQILKTTCNPVFNPLDAFSIRSAVDEAVNMLEDGNVVGIRNYHYAEEHWQIPQVTMIISDNLKQAIKKR